MFARWMTLTSCIRSGHPKRSSPWSSTWKPRAMNWSAWKLPHLPWRMCSSNSLEGGYAIEKLRRPYAHARSACVSQQDVFLFRDRHAPGVLFSLRRRFRQERAAHRQLLSRAGAGVQRHGQLLGAQRHAGDVSRARNSSPLSRRAGDRQRSAGFEYCCQLRSHSAHRYAGIGSCSPYLSRPKYRESDFSLHPPLHRHPLIWVARLGRRQRHQYHAGNPGVEPAPLASFDFSFRGHISTRLFAAHRAAIRLVSSRNLSGERPPADDYSLRHALEPLRGDPLACRLGVSYLLSLRATVPLGTGSQSSAKNQDAGCGYGHSLSPSGNCGERVGPHSPGSLHRVRIVHLGTSDPAASFFEHAGKTWRSEQPFPQQSKPSEAVAANLVSAFSPRAPRSSLTLALPYRILNFPAAPLRAA